MTGATGMDNAALPGVDIVRDLMDVPYPFPDQSADEIYLNHVIEHFVFADGQRIMSEAHRVLRPRGVVHIRLPHVFTIAAWADPTHKSAFTFQVENSKIRVLQKRTIANSTRGGS